MRKVLIDTNIALDMLQKREPFAIDALELFALAEEGKVKLYLSTDSLSTIFYIVKKSSGIKVAREAVSKILDFVSLGALDEKAVLQGMSFDFDDIEDAFIAAVAQKINAEAIVTRNLADFKLSPVAALPPREFIASL